jgi:replicative DNA helicase
MAELQSAATGQSALEVKLSVGDRWAGFLDELEAGADPRALDTPWMDLNDVVELKPGQLITVGAATGGGKSLFGMNLAAHVALTRARPVLVASMEMGGSELMARLTAAEATVELDRLIRRQLSDPTGRRSSRRVRPAPERGQLHPRRLPEPHPVQDPCPHPLDGIHRRTPAMVVADYLQLMTPEGSTSTTNRATEVATISRGLKLLAMEFEIPVVALAQFNRGAVGRSRSSPTSRTPRPSSRTPT